ncbi:MAG: S-methyl-5-thioribose-1-phosphate isomerase [Pirellulales bacterium]
MNQPTLRWRAEGPSGLPGYLSLIDQTLLPGQLVELECRHVEVVWEAIRSLRVRGAPAIGIAAAYGVCVDLQKHVGQDRRSFQARLDEVTAYLAGSRPTAVNLFWALDRLQRVAAARPDASPPDLLAALLAEARAIEEEDRQACRAIGRFSAELLADAGVLTHCNAGGLATADYGTALAVIFQAHEQGKRPKVFVDETRPLLQGARLTAWELVQRGIDATLICDSMAAQVMREGRVQAVVTGADRIAANGDTANKIGTYSVAVLAAAHNIPFYIAAPTSTFDLALESGDSIPIEQRPAAEITDSFGRRTAPEGVAVYNPAFDVTPARLIRAIVCERGVVQPVNREAIHAMAAR